jgi:hypothetical protein
MSDASVSKRRRSSVTGNYRSAPRTEPPRWRQRWASDAAPLA